MRKELLDELMIISEEEKKYKSGQSTVNGLTAEAKRQMNKEIAYAIGHVSELKNGSPGVRRAIIWGMAIHSLTDVFSHSVFIKGSDNRYHHMVHKKKNAYNQDPYYTKLHEKDVVPERWQCAKNAMYAALVQYEKSSHPCGTYKEFSCVLDATTFKLGNLSSFIQDVTKSQPLGAKYMYASYSI